jgi:DNA-binding LytR/AlgR family response regulator
MADFLQNAVQVVEKWPGKPAGFSVHTFSDADGLITAHNQSPFDIIFLDVVMPLLGGIEAAGEIRQYDPSVKIVFLTSSPEFAVDSYTVKASNYLLKPLDDQKLYACLDELTAQIHQSAKRILIRDRHAVHRVALQDIAFIESDNKYIHFSLTDGRTLTSSEPLYLYENKLLLADGFFKCSRSYIVNIHRIDSFTAKEIRMQSGYRIPISRSFQKEFESAYFATLFGKAGDL